MFTLSGKALLQTNRLKAKKDESKKSTTVNKGFESSKLGATANVLVFDFGDAKVKGNAISLAPYYKLQKQLSESLKYGFYFGMPFTFYTGDLKDAMDNSIAFLMKNGIVVQVKPSLAFAAGIQTVLPTIYFGDNDIPNGEFSNTFFMGFGIKASDEVEIDIAANIKPTQDDNAASNGESLDELWTQTFGISISIKL